jgi:hypothetical protein
VNSSSVIAPSRSASSAPKSASARAAFRASAEIVVESALTGSAGLGGETAANEYDSCWKEMLVMVTRAFLMAPLSDAHDRLSRAIGRRRRTLIAGMGSAVRP